MKVKTVLGVGMGALMLFGCAGYALSNGVIAQAETATPTAEEEVLSQEGDNGVQFSTNGSEWISQKDYEQNQPQIEWWTAAEYENWILEQRSELEALIGTGNGWYDGKNVYHEWTKEMVDAEMAQYEEVLEKIKAGELYSKPNGDNICYTQIPPKDEDIVCGYSADIRKDDGSTIHIGEYETEIELKAAIDKAVEKGTLTQEEADSLIYQ